MTRGLKIVKKFRQSETADSSCINKVHIFLPKNSCTLENEALNSL